MRVGGLRRFFELMSSEIAYCENCAPPLSAAGSREEIREEIRVLSKMINAVSTLENYSKAINFADNYGNTHASYFLLQFDYQTRQVSVQPFVQYEAGSDRYTEEEKNYQKNTVLVEVSKVEDLKTAFPNYFLDVSYFTDFLRKVLAPQFKSPQAYDLSWLKRFS